MKQLYPLAIALLSLQFISAQQGINYKAIIKNGSGNLVANDLIAIQFTILKGAGMTNIYQEAHTPNTDANGIAIVNIGEGTTSDVFADIEWGSDDHYLNVQINTGSGLTDMGTTQFMAVPYALHSNSVDSKTIKINDLVDGKSDIDDGSSLFLGSEAGINDNGTFNRNVGIGFNAFYSSVTGERNVAIGNQALYSNTTAKSNTATGYQALYGNTIGWYNTANGASALYFNDTGERNTAIGDHALYNNISGDENTATGFDALRNNIGSSNTANGYQALYSNTSGIRNTAAGFEALLSNTTGNYNTGFGYKTLHSQTTGHWNTAIGRNALLNLTAGTNNIGIGYNAQSSTTTASNEVTIGNSSNNVYRMYASSWTNASDIKLKHAIKNIPVGLDFVLNLRPVQFVYNNANNEEKTFGFIAQEVKEVVKQSNLEDNILVSPLNEKYLGLRTTELISVLTKAIQEQQDIIEKQNKENKSLEVRLTNVEQLLNSMSN